eukprot:COSAG03_NODE_1231_length_4511_cov_3.234134_6_plen_55_part_00
MSRDGVGQLLPRHGSLMLSLWSLPACMLEPTAGQATCTAGARRVRLGIFDLTCP